MKDLSFMNHATTVPYESFAKGGENLLQDFPVARDFFDSIVAASALLGRNTEYYADRDIVLADGGKWDGFALTKVFSSTNATKYNYRVCFAEKPESAMEAQVSTFFAFFLEQDSDMHETVIMVDCRDVARAGKTAEEFNNFYEEIEDFLAQNNMVLDEKHMGSPLDMDDEEVEDEDLKRITLSVILLPTTTPEDLMNLYMRVRYIAEPDLRDDPLGVL